VTSKDCALCGLPCGARPVDSSGLAFCCPGCLNVYTILRESGVIGSVQDFRSTEIYRRSLELGLIANPSSAERAPAVASEAPGTREVLFHVAGMWCTSCAWLIERAVCSERGVVGAEVIFASDLVRVRYNPQVIPPSRIAAIIDSLGYRAEECRGLGGRQEDTVRRDLLLRMGVAAFLWLNVMTFSLVVYVGYFEVVNEAARRMIPLVLMVLSAPAVFWSAAPILRAAWFGLRRGVIRVELLLALGILAAWGYSSSQAIAGGDHIYFDTACAIVTLLLAGKLLEHGAKQRTARAVELLYRLMPRKARVLRDGRERFVSIEALQSGMLFLVKPGERVPADGTVQEGESFVDESILTGESRPIERRTGDNVVGGSLNTGGVLKVSASAVGTQSTLSQIIRSVEAALASRSDLERTVDRLARAFVPAVIVLAVASAIFVFVLTGDAETALVRAIAVLVIACPCALGIATPLALTGAVGQASRRGILVNDVRVLETVRRVDVVLLDKTGTVTEGRFQLTGSLGDMEVLSAVVSLETNSEHPIGQALTLWARGSGLLAGSASAGSGITVRSGSGIEGHVMNRDVFAGNRALALSRGAGIPAALEKQAREWEGAGYTVVFFGEGQTVAGVLAFGDRIRPDAAGLVRDLGKRGIRTVLISGDSRETTSAVAAAIGVGDYRAEIPPVGKASVVREFQKSGLVVAMAGDGINDAPALAQADLGIALGSGSDLAMKAAPMVLMNNSLGRLPEAFDLAARTFAIVRQNLFWAFIYNVAGITLAITGMLNPIMAAGAMVLSSLSVLSNSLRIGVGPR
jgi:heavy metal translocating P-type ATPase